MPRLRTALIACWMLLVLCGLWAELWKAIVGRNTAEDWVHFFGLSYEQNLPTWYSSSLLMLCGFSLMQIARAKIEAADPYRRHWFGLGVVFFYVSLDEFATIHENLNQYFEFRGAFYFGWVIPAGIAVFLLGLAYLRFLGHLESSTRRQFLLAAGLYVGGALGVELILGWWTDYAGSKNLIYGLIDLTEESMEIAGASVFLHKLRELAVSSVPPSRRDDQGGAAERSDDA